MLSLGTRAQPRHRSFEMRSAWRLGNVKSVCLWRRRCGVVRSAETSHSAAESLLGPSWRDAAAQPSPGTEANSVLGRCSVNIFAFHLHASPGCRRVRAACVRLLTNKEVSSSLTSRVVVQSQCPPPGPPGPPGPARPAQPGHTASTDHNTQLGLGLGLSSAF